MTHVYIANALTHERSALRLMLWDLGMEIVGEAADWLTTLVNATATQLDILLVDWALLPIDVGAQELANLRAACSSKIVIVLISNLKVRQQAALSSGADEFISRGVTAEQVAECLRNAARWVHPT